MRSGRFVSTAALTLGLPLCVVSAALAQIDRERYTIRAVRVETAPRIDGVLDDDAWRRAPVIDEFTQQEPNEGAPASERTEVRVLYDSRHLFIAVRLRLSAVRHRSRRRCDATPTGCSRRTASRSSPIPIVAGTRLAGKAGAHNIGLLNIQTDNAFGRPGENFLVGRYSQDVLRRSRIGAIFINKEAAGGSPHFNRTLGADVNLAVGRHLQVNSFVARTSTPGLNGQDMAFFGRVAYRSPMWNLYLNYLDVQDHFNAEVGFVQRRNAEEFDLFS